MAKFKHNPITNELDLVGVDIAAAVLDTVSGSLVFNKNNSTSIDFQAKSLNSDSIIFVDSSADRIGFALNGLLPTDGLVHIQSGVAGTVAASTSADELILEGSGATGLTILTPISGTANIFFGTPTSNFNGFIQYAQTTDAFLFGSSAIEKFRLTASGVVFNENGVAGSDFRIEGLTNTHLVFCDAGNNRIGFSNASLLPTDGLVHIQSATAGAVAAAASADELVLEGSGDSGLTILSGTTSTSNIFMGSTVSSSRAQINYNHSADRMGFVGAGVERFRLALTNMILNPASADYDLIYESPTSNRLLFINTGADRISFSNASLEGTDGIVHIIAGTAGTVTASGSANLLVLESNVTQGLTILTPATAQGLIFFGSPTAPNDGKIVYDQSTRVLAFGGTGVSNVLEVSNMGVVINNLGTSTNDFRIEGDTLNNLFFVDVGTQNIIINGSTSATSSIGNLHINNGTSPTAVLADGIVLGSKNSGVGSLLAVPELWIENPPEVIGTFTPSHKFKTWINGTEYFIQLDAA